MNKDKMPLVSIIIPVYNGENYVCEAIDSALNQTYENVEILVINDGSIDDTEELCKKYENKIRYYKKKNGGVASALNLGIEKMNGTYFSWLSHDDLYAPRKIEEEIQRINEIGNPMAIVTCNYDFVGPDGKLLYKNEFDKSILKDTQGYKYLFDFIVHGCAFLINKEYFHMCGLFDEELPTTQDFDMWFRILRNNNLYFVDKVLVHSRVHDKQGSKEHLDIHIKECERLWINFFENLSTEEMKNLYGSELNFYNTVISKMKKYVNYPNMFDYLEIKRIKAVRKDPDEALKFLKNNYSIGATKAAELLNNNTNKRKVLFGCFGSWSDRGGLNRVVANISNGLVDNFDIYLITSGDIDSGYELDKRVKVINYEFKPFKADFFLQVYSLINFFDIDVFINPYNCLSRFVELMGYLKERKIKVIAWNHEYYFLPYYDSKYFDVLTNRNSVFGKLDSVMWLTSSSHMFYSQLYDNSLVMKNALTLNSELKISDFSDSAIISIGRFDDIRKSAEDLVILAKHLKEAGIKVKIKLYGKFDLELVGAASNKPLKELIEEYDLTDEEIEFMGFVKNIEEVYSHAKVNILLSYHEGFGLTIIEAASYGIPTIAYNDSGFEDMIENGKNGYLVNRNDYAKLVEVIKEIYTKPNVFDKMSYAAKKKAKEYSLNNILFQWKEVLNSIIEGKSVTDDYSVDCDTKLLFRNAINEYETSIKKILLSNTKSENLDDLISINKCIQELSNELDNVYNSNSMKITKPLRKLRRLIRKLLKRDI